MEDNDDLELGNEGDVAAGTGAHSTRPIRKHIAIKLKPAGRSQAAKEKKGSRAKSNKDTGSQNLQSDALQAEDIAKALQFTTMKNATPSSEPVHKNQKLKWDHKVNLIGEKVVDPLIHNCEKCSLPILIYGRMLPCKHVFCYACAKKTEKNCPRCNGMINRIEQSALGTVFVCTVGGTKHGTAGCHRTYLSQRDLQSHIAHRHMSRPEARHQEPVCGPMTQTEALQLHQVSPGIIHQPMVATAPQHQLEFISAAPSMPGGHAAQIQYNPSQPPPQLHDPSLIFHHQVQQRPMEELRIQMPPPQGLLTHATLAPPPHGAMGAPPMILPHSMKPQALPPPPHAIQQQVLNPPPGMSPRLTAVQAQSMTMQPPPGGMQPPQSLPLQGLGHSVQMHVSHAVSQGHAPSGTTAHGTENFHTIPVMASRCTNLITVPIQDEGNFHRSEQNPRGVPYHDGPGMYQTQGGPPTPQSAQHYTPSSHTVPKPCAPGASQVYTTPPPGHAPQFVSQAPPHHIMARPGGSPMGHPTSHPPPRVGPPVNIHSGPPPRGFPSPHHQYEEQHSPYGQPPGSQSTPMPWPPTGPGGPQRGPAPQRQPGSSGNMGPPHSMPYYQ